VTKMDERDWSDGSAALFREARSDHDATLADRARVHAALVDRLANQGAAASTSTVANKASQSVTVGNVAKLTLGIAILMAGSFALTRVFDRSAPEPLAEPLSAPRTMQQPALLPVTAPPTLPSPLEPRPARARTESVPAQAPAPKPRVLRAHTARATRPQPPPPIAAEVNAEPLPTRSLPSLEEPKELATVQPQARSQTQLPSEAAPVDDSIDTRAELSLVERIHAALRNAKPQAVLALCAEHEQRWPRGTFVQEREGARAVASCATRSAQAPSLARAFLAKNSNAPLAPRVIEACASELAAPPKRPAMPDVD
jgi:hypothetical protein